jgi:hypothetical protein
LLGLNRLLQILTGRAMDQKHPPDTASLALANRATVEPYMVRRPDSNSKYSGLAINGNAPGTNPLLDLATRR